MAASRIPHRCTDLWSQDHYGRKSQVEAPQMPVFPQDSNSKAILHPLEELKRLVPPLTAWKKQGQWPRPYSAWPVQKADGSWRMTVGYCHCYQVMAPIAVAVPNEVSLLEQINTALGSWCKLLTWQMLFSPYQFPRTTQKPRVHILTALPRGDISSPTFCHDTGCWELDLRSPHSSTLICCIDGANRIWWAESSFVRGVGSKPPADRSLVQSGDENTTSYLTRIILIEHRGFNKKNCKLNVKLLTT